MLNLFEHRGVLLLLHPRPGIDFLVHLGVEGFLCLFSIPFLFSQSDILGLDGQFGVGGVCIEIGIL